MHSIMRHRSHGTRRFPIFLLVVVALVFLAAAAVMLLWNAVLPGIAPVKALTYPQALGLLALCRILFGGFGGRSRGPAAWRGRAHWREKWRGMSEEDRLRFREEWKARCAARKGQGFDRGFSGHDAEGRNASTP